MEKNSLTKKWEDIGKIWLTKGLAGVSFKKDIDGKDIEYIFNPKQDKFINSFKRYNCYSGGFGCGKSLAMLIKLTLMNLCFPGNRILLGRKTLSDIDLSVLPDWFELIPSHYYTHRVKAGIIKFFNGSETLLFPLDALQEGSGKDIKKAQQKVKSLNLGAFFIEQAEEVEKGVFDMISSRLRRTNVPIRQGNIVCNPANFWAYHFFKGTPHKDSFLVEGSMLDNKEFLPDDYLTDQLGREESYVNRYVHGLWDLSVLIENNVFAAEHIKRMDDSRRKPITMEEGCEIWEQPILDRRYRMGVDPSEGVNDPASISVIGEDGKKVAKFNGLVPIPAQIDKVKFLHYKYNKALIIPEVNASGIALLEGIKDLRVYRRRVFEYKEKKWQEKLGFKTSWQSKSALINHFKKLLRKNYPKIYDEQTIEQFKSFVWTDSAKQKGAGAPSGFQDDDVMSTLLGYWEITPKIVAQRRFQRSQPKKRRIFPYI